MHMMDILSLRECLVATIPNLELGLIISPSKNWMLNNQQCIPPTTTGSDCD